MAQNITLQGASYSDVPSVLLPKTGGGTASFTDVTDTTASANDVAAGKYFYTAAGVKTEGTSTGGGGTTAGTVTQDANGYIVLPETGGGGGGSSANIDDPIRFFDYDGTLVASYTSVPSSLPSVPTHTGLMDGTWNYTLQQVQTQFNAMGTCDVGANYTTSSGATEIDIVLENGYLSPYLMIAVNGTVSVDWGDGSSADTVTGTSLSYPTYQQHEYSVAGSYIIFITVVSGSFTFYNSSSAWASVLRSTTGSTNRAYNRIYSNDVMAIRIGSGVTNIGVNAFANCTSIRYVTIPSGVTSIGDSAFYNCYSLTSLSIPSGVTSIGNSAFYTCCTISTLEIPASVTSIGNSAFSSCYSITEYHFLRTESVPTLGTTAFASIMSDCKIYVPQSKLADYQAAENWSTYASYMVGE